MQRKKATVYINLGLAVLLDEIRKDLVKQGRPRITRRMLVEMILSDAVVNKKILAAPPIEKRTAVPDVDDRLPVMPKRKPDNATTLRICTLMQNRWVTLGEMQAQTRKSRRIVEAVAEDLVECGFAEKRRRAIAGRGRPSTEYSVRTPTVSDD